MKIGKDDYGGEKLRKQKTVKKERNYMFWVDKIW